MKLLKLSFACLLAFFSLSFAASMMEEKLNLEKSIQGNVERLVEKIIGSREMVVLVNVDLGEETSKTQGAKMLYPGQGMTEEEYLPGVTYTNVALSGTTSAKGIMIKKITVLITIDQSISEATVARMKKEVYELIGLDSIRGDVVNVQKIAFANTTFTLKEYIQGNWVKQAYWLLVVVILTIFLFGPLSIFFRNVLRTMEMRVNADTRSRSNEGGAGGGGSVGALPGQIQLVGGAGLGGGMAPAQKEGASGEKGQYRHFSFVDKDNLKNLVYLVKKESPENIAIIANYLTPEYAAQVLSSLTAQAQSQVLKNLAEVKLLDPEQVKKVESDFETKIAYLSGGEEYFLNLIEHSDADMHVSVLNALEQANPTIAERVRRELFFFEDINILEKTALQRLMREAQRRGFSMALALKKSSEDIKNKIMAIMTDDAKAMLKEQMDLLGEIADKRISEEQRAIANLARELDKAGVIIIDRTKKQAGA